MYSGMILPSTYKSPADFIDYRESRINNWWLDSNVRIPGASTMTSDSKRNRATALPPLPGRRFPGWGRDHPAAATLPQHKLRPVRKSNDLDLSILLQPPAVEDEPIAATLVFRCRLGMRIFGALQMNFAPVV